MDSNLMSDEIDKAWHVLVCGLSLDQDSFDLGEGLIIQRLPNALSVFDLAAAGAVGFREWAVLEPLASSATAEIISPLAAVTIPGYDALNKCWLVSALLVLRGFARQLCPAASAYSWALVAGQSQRDHERRLPTFQGSLLDYHLSILVPAGTKEHALSHEEAQWIAGNIGKFNALAASSERFRFALSASIDWRYAKDPRTAISRLWAGIECLFGISQELVFRLSLFGSTELAPRGPERLAAFKRLRAAYSIRSKAVHGEPVSREKLVAGMWDSFDILRLIVLNCVIRGSVPTEEDVYRELLC